MKTSILFVLAALVSLTACHQSAEVAPNEDVFALQEKFQGTYLPIHSESSLALDINQDGKASADMLEEISELPNMIVELIISSKNKYKIKSPFLFVHHWPKQWLGRVEPTTFDPSIKPFYDRTVVTWRFAFDSGLTEFVIEPDPTFLADPDLYSPLQKVKVKGNDRIEVTLTKRLYSTAG